MTGQVTTPRVFTFYQYDPPAAHVLNMQVRPKTAIIPETSISIYNTFLFERPVLYIEMHQKMQLPPHIQSDHQFMKYLSACSLSIPNEHLPSTLSPTSKVIHTHKINEAFSMFTRLANEKFPPAAHYLGLCFLTGNGIVQNTDHAVRYIQIAADRGFTPAQVTLGYLYENGIGFPTNLRLAASLYQQSIKYNNALGFFLLAQCYEYAKGVPENLRKASALYQEAAKLDMLAARHAINRVYGKIVNAGPTLTTMIRAVQPDSPPEIPFEMPLFPLLLPPIPDPIPLPQKRVAERSRTKTSASKRIAKGKTKS
ncbi:MAG: sel1 repeat family protein [Alphaproteobacteria bacterium]|nr:sel1 repeat family protein [Alphaproteobacteria bacterium]MBP9878393.1 sel1 repeat family protein [Alphaproteobacteria bacterium]